MRVTEFGGITTILCLLTTTVVTALPAQPEVLSPIVVPGSITPGPTETNDYVKDVLGHVNVFARMEVIKDPSSEQRTHMLNIADFLMKHPDLLKHVIVTQNEKHLQILTRSLQQYNGDYNEGWEEDTPKDRFEHLSSQYDGPLFTEVSNANLELDRLIEQARIKNEGLDTEDEMPVVRDVVEFLSWYPNISGQMRFHVYVRDLKAKREILKTGNPMRKGNSLLDEFRGFQQASIDDC